MQQAKRPLTLLFALALTIGLLVAPAGANGGYSDTHGHWAEAAIDRWSGYDIVEGSSGAFLPDAAMTRGQLAKVLSNLLGLTETAGENPFSDVPATEWYAPYMLRCHAAGILLGADGKGSPDAPVSREEALTLIARALDIAPVDAAALDGYRDASGVADWAAGYVAALAAAGVVGGVGNAMLAPRGNVDRASVMTVFDKAIAQYINASGTYELADRNGVVLVAAGGVTLTGATRADVLISHAADGKAVNFDKATVTGKLTVQADSAKITASADSKLPTPAMRGASSVYAGATASSSGGGSTVTVNAPSPVAPDAPAPAAPHTHIWDNGVVTVAATCTTAGSKVYTCSGADCPLENAQRVEPISALGHQYALMWSSDAEKHWRICTHDESHHGYEAAHIWDGGAVTTPATAGEDGVMTHTCTVCGKTKTEPIPATGLYTVTLDADTGGTLTAAPTQKAGTELTVTITADEGYAYSGGEFYYADATTLLTVDNLNETVRTTTLTFPMPSADVTVRAHFSPGLAARLETEGTVTLEKDIVAENVTMRGKTATLDLNGHRIDLSMLTVGEDASLTITGDGVLSTKGAYGIHNRGKLTVEGGTVTARGAPLYQESGTMTITGGKFLRNGNGNFKTKQALLVTGGAVFISGGEFDGGAGNAAVYVEDAVSVSISGGAFLSADLDDNSICVNGDGCAPTITGGTFYEKPAAAWIPATHTAVKNSDDTWTVTATE